MSMAIEALQTRSCGSNSKFITIADDQYLRNFDRMRSETAVGLIEDGWREEVQ